MPRCMNEKNVSVDASLFIPPTTMVRLKKKRYTWGWAVSDCLVIEGIGVGHVTVCHRRNFKLELNKQLQSNHPISIYLVRAFRDVYRYSWLKPQRWRVEHRSYNIVYVLYPPHTHTYNKTYSILPDFTFAVYLTITFVEWKHHKDLTRYFWLQSFTEKQEKKCKTKTKSLLTERTGCLLT